MEIPLPIIAAITGALSAGIVSLFTLRRRSREEAALRHLQRQIEELYGPLYGLIQYGAAINDIEMLRLPDSARDARGRPLDEEGGKVLRFFREHYYLPLNQQIVELIRTKVYLLDSDSIPKTFNGFIRHAAQLDCFHRLWKEADISTHGIEPIEYPLDFKSDVERTLNELRREYNEYIRRMKGNSQLERSDKTHS